MTATEVKRDLPIFKTGKIFAVQETVQYQF